MTDLQLMARIIRSFYHNPTKPNLTIEEIHEFIQQRFKVEFDKARIEPILKVLQKEWLVGKGWLEYPDYRVYYYSWVIRMGKDGRQPYHQRSLIKQQLDQN